MGLFFYYASFPNSRNRPRPATTAATTDQVPILDFTQPPTLVVPATSNRTYAILENFSATTAFWYVYATTSAVNPSVTPTFGNKFDLILFTGTHQLYQKQDVGTNTNWTPVAIENVGEKVLQLQTANVESPQDIYCSADSNAPVVPPVVIGVDEGVG